jgi:putative SOS response-associated peptidase YedK
MPVMLCEAEAWDVWLTGSIDEALELQVPLPAARLNIVRCRSAMRFANIAMLCVGG